MATVLIGRNTTVEVENTLGAAVTITAIKQADWLASPSGEQVTANAHGFINGDIVVFTVSGMSQLDGQVARVANKTTNTFDIEGIDTTLYSAFTSGTVQKVSAFLTLGVARSVQAGNVSPNRLESTTLLDNEKQYVLGMSDTPEITIDILSAPLDSAVVRLDTAARLGSNIVFRLTMSDASKRLFRGQVTTASESISVNELVTGSLAVTQTRRRLAYAS